MGHILNRQKRSFFHSKERRSGVVSAKHLRLHGIAKGNL
jgi:hypothetical protein